MSWDLNADAGLSRYSITLYVQSTARIEIALHTSVALRTGQAQWCTARSHITNLCLSARSIRTIGRHHTLLPLIRVELAHKAMVLLHRLRDRVPEGRVEWSITWPIRRRTVCLSSAVLKSTRNVLGLGHRDQGARTHRLDRRPFGYPEMGRC